MMKKTLGLAIVALGLTQAVESFSQGAAGSDSVGEATSGKASANVLISSSVCPQVGVARVGSRMCESLLRIRNALADIYLQHAASFAAKFLFALSSRLSTKKDENAARGEL